MRHRKQRPGGQPTPGPTHQMPHRGAPSLRCPPVLRSAAPGAAPPPARRHDGAWDGSTQGALQKMRRQGAVTPGAPHRVSVGGAPSHCLPRPPHTAPLRRLPPAPPPCALVSSPEKVITVQCRNSCNLQFKVKDLCFLRHTAFDWYSSIVQKACHRGGLGITPNAASSIFAYYSATAQYVSWVHQLPNAELLGWWTGSHPT